MQSVGESTKGAIKKQTAAAPLANSIVTVQIGGDVTQVHTHTYEAPEAANDGPDSLDDEAHQALMREQRRREEFKRVTGGIDEWRPRRVQLHNLISRFDLDPKEVGELYRHGYLSFKDGQLRLDRSRAPAIGAALLWGPGNLPCALLVWAFFTLKDQRAAVIAFALFGAWFITTTFVAARVMRRWYMARRVGRCMQGDEGRAK